MYKMKKLIYKIAFALILPGMWVSGGLLTSCADMLDTSSEMKQFTEDSSLSTPQDTLFNVMGIIRSLQVIADRNVVLGELRSDLCVSTDKATKDIKNVAAFDFSEDNKYNHISDYYAVINNCNYFIANADTSLVRLGQKIFEREYSAVKSYRAWTYLQMAKIYGEVPLVLDPVLTEADAEREMNKKPSSIEEICNYFIDDIKGNVDIELPRYGSSMDVFTPSQFFIPVRVLLGDLCLWAGRYKESAQYLADYLTLKNHEVTTGVQSARWSVTDLDFSKGTVNGAPYLSGFNSSRTSEAITLIPMEESEFSGVKSEIEDIFSSTENNYYYYQATPSKAYRDYSAAENYCHLEVTKVGQDTVYAPKENLQREEYKGDLRFTAIYRGQKINQDEFSKYSSDYQIVSKQWGRFFMIYRIQQVYLMFAEALCRAGFPETSFCILKYGLIHRYIEKISPEEREGAKSMLNFPENVFTDKDMQGIHSRGCGNAECDTLYTMPKPEKALASHADSVAYQIPLVEDMIIREMALEKAFEGERYYDLMRVALRRNDNTYLAAPISKRTGTQDEKLFTILMNRSNWYLPKK